MKSRIFAVIAVLALALAPALLAQGRGGGSGQRGQGPSATSQQRGGQQGQTGQQGSMQQQKRQRIHVNEQQQNQYRTCTQSADRVRTQARQMAQAAKGGGANNPEFREQHQRLREEIRTMQQEHGRFMNGLSDEQRTQMQDRIRKMDQARERVHTQLQAMDQELNQANPDVKLLEKRAREMEKATKQWQKENRRLGDDLDLEP